MPQPAQTDQERFFETRLRLLSGALREFAEATADYARLLDVVASTLAAVVRTPAWCGSSRRTAG
jgi:hypothetical protein